MTRIRQGIIRYGELTSPEAAAAREAGALLILPVGAVEQHGNGLPLATDNIRGEHVAERVAGELDLAFVLPPVSYGVSPHHLGLAGTITLDPKLFIAIVESIALNLAEAGWSKLLVVTGHGGNNAALGVVQQSLLGSHPGFQFAFTPISAVAKKATAQMSRTEISGHSGESETSQVLAIDPSLVHREALSEGATTMESMNQRAQLSRRGTPSVAVRFSEYAENGVLGDPRTATATDGQAVLDEAVTVIAGFARELINS